jgi:hypothetical protein
VLDNTLVKANTAINTAQHTTVALEHLNFASTEHANIADESHCTHRMIVVLFITVIILPLTQLSASISHSSASHIPKLSPSSWSCYCMQQQVLQQQCMPDVYASRSVHLRQVVFEEQQLTEHTS